MLGGSEAAISYGLMAASRPHITPAVKYLKVVIPAEAGHEVKL